MYLYLAVLTIGSTVGLQAWTTLFNNFAVEVAGLEGDHIGAVPALHKGGRSYCKDRMTRDARMQAGQLALVIQRTDQFALGDRMKVVVLNVLLARP